MGQSQASEEGSEIPEAFFADPGILDYPFTRKNWNSGNSLRCTAPMEPTEATNFKVADQEGGRG